MTSPELEDPLAKGFSEAKRVILENPQPLIELEKIYSKKIIELCQEVSGKIKVEFDTSIDLKPFWWNYSPRPRGRKPREDSIPWGEVGEKTISHNVAAKLEKFFGKDIAFMGLPFGGDLRFMTNDAIIHLDVKLTGPNDNPNEIVVSPNQVSGDGSNWNKTGYENSPVTVNGPRKKMIFQPELPPIYLVKKGKEIQVKYCLTYFLKVVYSVKSKGEQPLELIEVVSVPNGLLLFAGPNYSTTEGLFTPGKDEQTFKHKRTRIKLDPLSKIDSWRCVKIKHENGGWKTNNRS